MTKLQKCKKHMFGKDIYLLGTDEDGIKYWLEEPSWDCGWYWGFGYIETYTNNRCIEQSRDIQSHQHADHFYSEWCEKVLKSKTFSNDEKWALCELFQNFYTLKGLAETQYHKGKEDNWTSERNGFDYRELLREDVNINRDCLPFVMAKIISILSPDENETVEFLESKYVGKLKG